MVGKLKYGFHGEFFSVGGLEIKTRVAVKIVQRYIEVAHFVKCGVGNIVGLGVIHH